MRIRNKQKYEVAKEEFLTTDKTQEEIAEIAGVSSKTLRKWINEFNWKEEKRNRRITKSGIVNNLYERINELSQADAVGKAREISMLMNAIEKMSTTPQLHHFIQCFKEFNQFLLSKKELELTKQLNHYQIPFLSQLED